MTAQADEADGSFWKNATSPRFTYFFVVVFLLELFFY